MLALPGAHTMNNSIQSEHLVLCLPWSLAHAAREWSVAPVGSSASRGAIIRAFTQIWRHFTQFLGQPPSPSLFNFSTKKPVPINAIPSHRNIFHSL